MDRRRIFGRPVEELISAELVLGQARLRQHRSQQRLAESSTFRVCRRSRKVVQNEEFSC